MNRYRVSRLLEVENPARLPSGLFQRVVGRIWCLLQRDLQMVRAEGVPDGCSVDVAELTFN